jgi:hypothetical protein
VNLMLTMLLGGLWHGASWTFVVWGGLHGAYLVVNHFWQWLRERFGWQRAVTGVASIFTRGASVALTLLCVMIGWVFFRAVDTATATNILASMFGLRDGGVPLDSLAGYSLGTGVWIALFSVIALFGRNSQQLIDGTLTAWLDRHAVRVHHAEWLAWMSGAMCIGVAWMAIAAASRNVIEFIYFNF